MKYIVKNCPARDYYKGEYLCLPVGFKTKCQDVTDCVIKQTIDLWRKHACGGLDCEDFAQEMLKKWETEDVENAG